MTTTTTETVQRLAIEAIVPDPANRKVVLDAQFVASIRIHGVLQPLLVTPDAEEEGRFHLVAGHRRLGAAAKAGLRTVPALVRTLSEQEKLELALVDNLHRQDLSPTEEAVAMARLVEFGMSAPKLARRIGRSAGYVRDRLRLLELPAQARRLIDDGMLGLEQGLALVPLVDHPDTLTAVVARIAEGNRNVEWMVTSALRQIATDTLVAEGRSKAEAKGLRVVEDEGHHPSGYVEIGTYGGLDIDAKAHATEPCHGVVISARDGKAIPVCTDKKRHAHRGASPIKRAPTPGPDAEARAAKAARKQAAEHRGDFVATVVAGRVVKANVLRLVLATYLEGANANEEAATARLLGVDAAATNSYDRWGEALRQYAASSETSLMRACLALALVQGEDALAGGWGYDRAERHRAFLAAKGYEPAAYEIEQAEAAARRHENNVQSRPELANAEGEHEIIDPLGDSADEGVEPDGAS